MEKNITIMLAVHLVLMVLSLTLLAYNYRTKYVCGNGVYERVYSNGGVLFRLLASWVPMLNLLCIVSMLIDPFGEYQTWMDVRSGKPCRRARFQLWVEEHKKVRQVGGGEC